MSETMQAYCVKCKEKRNMINQEAVYTKTGTPATKGQCEVCGTNLFRMGVTDAHANVPKPEVIEKPKRAKKATKGKKGKSKTVRKKGKLVIVESPTKARSIGSYLGKDYTVLASKGHVRDLLVSQISVDVENNFEPKYRVPNDKRPVVKQIKEAVARAEEIYLATDPDREGEAIAWHLFEATDMPPETTKRVVFHQITKDTVREAFDEPRDIDMNLVNAQQARRILDRLVGYNITELLWDKVRNRLSAGRVQSIALRIVVEREREIEAFNPQEYWSLEADLHPTSSSDKDKFVARLVKIDGEDPVLDSEATVQPHLDALNKSMFVVSNVKRGERRRKPSAPFTTSTLQQEASRRIGFNARRTMSVAQQLYEGIDLKGEGIEGLITYMRTDSVTVAPEAVQQARDYVTNEFGADYIPEKLPTYKTRSKSAQEAHEAIRPTNIERTPKSLKDILSREQMRLYTLIWERFVASQMSNAVYDTLRVDMNAGEDESQLRYQFRSSGSRIRFQGFLALYEDAQDEDVKKDDDEGRILPDMSPQDALTLLGLNPAQHFTQPPPRFTEASLVRTLEEYGIGRPSTYAPTVAVIQDRDYVTKTDKRLVPTDTGKVVSELLVQYFPEEMDYQFTAKMEQQLDSVADTDGVWRPVLADFYDPFESRLENARTNMPKMKQEESTGRTCPTCNTGELLIKYGRWGKFIGCSNYPECRHTEQYLELIDFSCPTCGVEHGGQVVERKTRRGRVFYGCSRYPDCDYSSWENPKKKSEKDASTGAVEISTLQDATG